MRLPITLFGLLLAEVCLAAPKVIAVDIDGVVHPVTAEIIGRAIEQAKLERAEILLIRLNTPGGLADATRQIIEKMVASPVPVVTFVTPSGGRAASAGFFILEASDLAVMAAGTNTGAAAPVLLGQEMDPVMRQKVQNDAAASMRSMATKRGRNSALAEKAVLESKSFTEKEALDNKLIDLIATDEADLYRQLNGREVVRFDGRKQVLRLEGVTVVNYQKTWREQIVSAIADPNLALVLLVLGALGIYVEFSSPGLIVPGVAGAILVLLGLSALSVLPINWVGVALLLLAVALFILEAKFASHGILGVGGTVSMILGALLLVDSPLPELRIHLSTAVGLALPFAIITTFLVSLVIRARANKVVTGAQGMLDELGVAHTALAPAGKVFVHGEYWDAVSSAPVEAGARVRVTDIQALTLKVEPVSKNSGG
jgi:membrane-bound serine protease (ClpP class)